MPASTAADGRAFFYSGGMHLALLIFAIFGLPDLFNYDREPEPIVVTLEALPISNISNVKPVPAPIAKPKPKPPTPTRVEKTTPPVEQKKPQPKENPVKVQEKKEAPPEKKQEEKPKEKPQNKDDLDAVLKSVREQAQQTENKEAPKKVQEQVQEAGTRSEKYDPSLPMSLSEMDAIKNQIAQCWAFDAGAMNSQDLVVKVEAKLSPDGTIVEAKLSNESYIRASSDGYYYAAARAALAALKKPECQQLKNLPSEKYSTWKEMDLIFDPRFLL